MGMAAVSDTVQIAGVVRGELRVSGAGRETRLGAGGFCLLPACVRDVALSALGETEFLLVRAGRGA